MDIDPRILSAIIGAISAVIGTLIVAWFGYKHFLREKNYRQEMLLNVLFGEMANILEHFYYAFHEFPTENPDEKKRKIRFSWSVYGKLQCVQEISQYGFLNAEDIQLLLQLDLRIRNNDTLMGIFLERHPITAISNDELEYAKGRMKYPFDTANTFLYRLVEKHPNLRKILDAVKRSLPEYQSEFPNH